MEHKNTTSDFDARIHLRECGSAAELGWPGFDWSMHFWTYSRCNGYRVACDGGACTNCYNDNGTIHAVFNSHGLGRGVLKAELSADIPDGSYPDGVHRSVVRCDFPLELWDRSDDCTGTVDLYVTLPHGFAGDTPGTAGCAPSATWPEVRQVIDGLFDGAGV